MRFFLILTASIFLAGCGLNTSCVSKDSFISNYEKFSADIKENYEKLSIEDWTSIDEEFTSYVDVCYPKFKSELSLEEKVNFFKNTLSYGYYKGTKDGKIDIDLKLDLGDEMEEISIQGKEELEAFIKKEFGDDLESTIDDIVDGIKELGDEIKEWLKD